MKKHTKYPRTLAKTETTSRRQYNLDAITHDPKEFFLLSRKGAFTFLNAYPYIFDGLAYLCTNFANSMYPDPETAEERYIIERQDSPTETHYRTMITLDKFMEMALGEYSKKYRDSFLNELYHLSAKPEKKVLPFADGYNILTEPIRIDIILEDGSKLSESQKKQLSNIGPKNEYGERGVSGRVSYIIIEYYKPLFEPLLQRNKKGTNGAAFLQTPNALMASLRAVQDFLYSQTALPENFETEISKENDIFRKLKMSAIGDMLSHYPDEFIKEVASGDPESRGWADFETEFKLPMVPSEIRTIYLYMLMHDNRQGDYINLDILDLAESCFPSIVEIKKGRKYFRKIEKHRLLAKVAKAICSTAILATKGKMDGGQFVPLEAIIEDSKIKVTVLRPRNQKAPIYPELKKQPLLAGIDWEKSLYLLNRGEKTDKKKP